MRETTKKCNFTECLTYIGRVHYVWFVTCRLRMHWKRQCRSEAVGLWPYAYVICKRWYGNWLTCVRWIVSCDWRVYVGVQWRTRAEHRSSPVAVVVVRWWNGCLMVPTTVLTQAMKVCHCHRPSNRLTLLDSQR